MSEKDNQIYRLDDNHLITADSVLDLEVIKIKTEEFKKNIRKPIL